MSDKQIEVGRQAIGPESNINLPPADPSIGIEEIERRSGLVADPGPSTRLPPDVADRKRVAFMEEFGGYWIINCANVEFSTTCDCPNIRLVEYCATSAAADARIKELMLDPRVTSVPIKKAANMPFQIPVSEASALDPVHTMSKVQRNLIRYIKFIEYRNEEFQKHVSEKTPGETGRSTYTRRKAYLDRQKSREQGRDGLLEPQKPFEVSGGGGVVDAGVSVASSGSPLEPIWSGELPSHWVKREGTVTADSWPRDLEARHGKYGVITFIEDEDEEADSPTYPKAAKREPILFLFGGMHETVEEAKEFMTKRIAPWCPDFTLDVVDMYEWLWPTEVDPDAIEEQHRTNHAGFDKELNTVMTTRKQTMKDAIEARENSANTGVPLRESNVNALPDIGSIVSERRQGMVAYELTDVEEKKDDALHLKSI